MLRISVLCALASVLFFPQLATAQSCDADSDCISKLVCGPQKTCIEPSKASKAKRSFCQYDYECGVAQQCINAKCVADFDAADQSANDQCGNDRRCRIDRLKRSNAAKRHIDQLNTERRLKEDLARAQQQKLKETPRVMKPMVFGLQESRLGPVPGVYFGWTFAGQVRANLDYQFSELDTYTNNGNQFAEIHWVTAAAEYFMFTGAFTPYLRAGFKLGSGTFDSYSYDAFGGGYSDDVKAVFHTLEGGAGFDVQFEFGMQARLGLAYRPVLYRQAKLSDGVYDPVAKEGMDELFKQCVAFDVVGAIGWAF